VPKGRHLTSLSKEVSWILAAEQVVCLTLSLAAQRVSLKSWSHTMVTGKNSSGGRAVKSGDRKRTLGLL